MVQTMFERLNSGSAITRWQLTVSCLSDGALNVASLRMTCRLCTVGTECSRNARRKKKSDPNDAFRKSRRGRKVTEAIIEQQTAPAMVPVSSGHPHAPRSEAPVKQKRCRLPKPSTQLARVLQRLEIVVRKHESGEVPISPSRFIDILLEQSRVASLLYRETLAADRKRAATERAVTARESEPARSVDEPDLSAFMEYHSGSRVKAT